VKFRLDTNPAGALLTITIEGVNGSKQSTAGEWWTWKPLKGKKCETFTVKAHWVSGAEASREVNVCDGKNTDNQTFYITRPRDVPGFDQDREYGHKIIQQQIERQQAQAAAPPAERTGLDWWLNAISEGLINASADANRTYTLTETRMDNQHGITYCYYHGMNGGLVEQHPTGSLVGGCPSTVTK
jgi:hypothetical protein